MRRDQDDAPCLFIDLLPDRIKINDPAGGWNYFVAGHLDVMNRRNRLKQGIGGSRAKQFVSRIGQQGKKIAVRNTGSGG
jgi:hypothetical protein